MTIEYRGPGFYNQYGERVCSFDSESMEEFIDSQGYAHIIDSTEYEHLKDDIVEQERRDYKNELYGPRKAYQLGDDIKWGGTD